MMDNSINKTSLNEISSRAGSSSALAGFSPELEQKISSALHRFETVVGKFLGIQIPAAPFRAWQQFSTLPEVAQNAIIAGINAQADFAQAAMDDGIEVVDEQTMLNWAKRKLGLLSEDSVLGHVTQGDVVEIFDDNAIQIYRSYSCFALCNYSLLELTSYPWYELYDRSTTVSKQLVEFSDAILHGKSSYLDLAGFPEYTLRELMTEEMSVFGIKEKFMAKMVSTVSARSFILSVKTVRQVPVDTGSTPISFI